MRGLGLVAATLGVLSHLGDARRTRSHKHAVAATNQIKNGNFANGISGFETQGEVHVIHGQGPSGDKDKTNNVVELVAGEGRQDTGFSKRLVFSSSSISTWLNGLFALKTYTVSFRYTVVSSTKANACQIQAYMGLSLVGTTPFFPQVTASTSPATWLTFSNSITVRGTSSSAVTILYCRNGGTARAQIDSISVIDASTIATTSSTSSTTMKSTTSTAISSTSTSTSTTSSVLSSSSVSSISISASSLASSSILTSTTSTTQISSSTGSSVISSSSVTTSSSTTSSSASSATIDSTILVIASDDYLASSGNLGLLAYGIPYENLIIPQAGRDLPVLNSSSTQGRYGGIIVMDSVSYNYDGAWRSAVTNAQWDALYAYQTNFNIRMVRINEFPGPKFGVAAVSGGCCGDGVDQLVSISNNSDFPTANIKTNAGLSTKGLYHVPATITDPSTTRQVGKFGIATGFTSESVAAVINNSNGREQFVWFISWAPDWSQTSSFLQHSHIHWLTRGLFLGKRKVHLSCQIDDVQLSTGLYYPAGKEFKLRTADIEGHIDWQNNLNARLPAGSDFWLELAHNGNGDFIAATALKGALGICSPESAVDYNYPPDTPLEYVKPPGSGTNLCPDNLVEYSWSKTCATLDEFASWFMKPDNINHFAHVSHTFTHLELNNATYADASREIHFNQDWMAQMGIDKAARFSARGLIPPAITGLHNADVIKAWMDNGIYHVVGDNTRPVLRNANSKYWPLISTVASNGYDGLIIVPRFATTIHYNCDTAECTTREWIATSAGSGDYTSLLNQARTDNTRYLLSLMADPYMFHQANMRQVDMDTITIGSQTGKMSLVMSWTETIVQEMMRLANWPIQSLKHDDFTQYFLDRKALDDCKPRLSYVFSENGLSIKSVTVTATGNTCSASIPVTIPSGSVTSQGSVTTDQIGTEPPIQWVTLSGSPVTLALGKPIAL
ncbi:hypothetical protein QQX98_002815 [Neonectria punicea]|uniref:Extracellular serine-rich protein n=1 Tax=Neonectria punicea TaxID=979145 RepID=A0ABR1HHT0_9HYPO